MVDRISTAVNLDEGARVSITQGLARGKTLGVVYIT
jgi:hypothetical protein